MVLPSSLAAEAMSTGLGLGTFLRISSIAVASYESVAPSHRRSASLPTFFQLPDYSPGGMEDVSFIWSAQV
jgi:hypothetical protein